MTDTDDGTDDDGDNDEGDVTNDAKSTFCATSFPSSRRTGNDWTHDCDGRTYDDVSACGVGA